MLQFILLPIAVAAGAGGLGLGFNGVADLASAKELSVEAEKCNEKNIARFTKAHENCQKQLEELGELEFNVVSYFQYFVDAYEKIVNRPEFSTKDFDVSLPEFDFKEIKTVSVAAKAFLGATVGATTGSIFGAAAASGTTSAVMTLGTASTGTAISSLSGAAATNAALAALGGGSIAAGGGGMALGAFVLNSVSLGAGLLIAGTVFAVAGNKVYKKADEMFDEMLNSEKNINENIRTIKEISVSAQRLKKALTIINNKAYVPNVVRLCKLVEEKNDWEFFSDDERKLVENNILVVTVLHKLANCSLYKATLADDAGNIENIEPNTEETNSVINESLDQMKKIKF